MVIDMTEIAELKLKLIESECHREWERLEYLKPRIEALDGDMNLINQEQEVYEKILKLIR